MGSYTLYSFVSGFFWASLVAQTVKNLPAMQETWFHPQVGKISWRREWQPSPVFLPGEFCEQRSLAGYSPQGRKESDLTEQQLSFLLHCTYLWVHLHCFCSCSFLLLCHSCFILWTYYRFSVLLSDHLHYFQFFAVTNSASMNYLGALKILSSFILVQKIQLLLFQNQIFSED